MPQVGYRDFFGVGMLLRNSPHKGTASYADVLKLTRIAHGEDLDGLREEFVRLAESARTMTIHSEQRAAGGGQE